MVRRRWAIGVVVLIATQVTCVDQRTPTSLATSGADSSRTSAALIAAPIAHTLLTSGNNTTNQKIYTTASIAPGPNALITVAVLGHNSTSAPPSPALSGGGMSEWTVVSSITLDAVGSPHKRLTIYRALSATPGSGPLTITWSASVSNCQWIVSQWDNVDPSGTNGGGAVVQSGSASGDATNGLTVSLAGFADPANAAYGVFAVNKNALAVTPGSGFSAIAQQPSNESPNADLQAEWATNDNTIDASWTGLNAGGIGVEIKSAGGSGGGGSVSPTLSTVTASPTSLVADLPLHLGSLSTITVTVKDAAGNPVSGAAVVLTATGTGNSFVQPGATDANGVATGYFNSEIAEVKTISAKANGTLLAQTAVVTIVPGSVSTNQSTVVAAPASIVPMTGTASITVTAKDRFGNPISGATVALVTTGSATVTQPADTTSASGVTTGSLTASMVEETVTITATVNGTEITQKPTVQIAAQTAATITQTLLTSGNNAVNQKVYTTATIAPAPNALVTLAVLMRRSGGVITPTISGGGFSAWQLVASADFDTQGTPTKRLLVFRALSATPTSGPITISFASSVSNVQWIVSQWVGVEPGGTNGSGAIVQTGMTRSDGATGLAVSLAPFASSNDVAFGLVGVAKNGPTVTPGAGLAEIDEVSSGETSALEAEWATSQQAPGASWGSLTKAGMLALEIKAGSGGGIPVATVTVTPPTAAVAVGGTTQLAASAADAGGEPLPGATFTWSSDATAVATVSSTGLVTGAGAGTATITASSGGKNGTATVTVTSSVEPVASVDVTPATADILSGGTLQLTATPKDAAGQPLSGRTITWGGGAAGIATVSATGLVTGVGAGGPVSVTATSEGKTGSASITVTAGGLASQVGQWSAVIPAPIVQVHQHLLLDGRVLSFGGSNGIPQVFDPATGVFTAVPISEIMFCSGHTWLPNGRLLVSGGGTGNGLGHTNSDIFDPVTASWIPGPTMNYARWYPTVTTLPDGRVVTMAGADQNGSPVPIPEVGDGTSWTALTGASMVLSNYPRNFVAPDGRIFMAGPSNPSQWFDVNGTGSWSSGPSMNYGGRGYGSAVMYEAGKILYVGGNSAPTNTAEIIDLNQANPQWQYTGSLTYARWNLNATVLPTGDVLVTGGVSGDRSNPALKVNATELWNPTSGTWTLLASSAPLLRGYHSTTLLLPDGRLIHSGGGAGGGTIDNLNYEIFSPPYLFKGARPTVTGGVPGTAAYGQRLLVGTPDFAGITKVSLIRFGSVTHAFDQGQRLVSLSFNRAIDALEVFLPASRNLAPPGPYMLFLVNGNGVPSVGQVVILQ